MIGYQIGYPMVQDAVLWRPSIVDLSCLRARGGARRGGAGHNVMSCHATACAPHLVHDGVRDKRVPNDGGRDLCTHPWRGPTEVMHGAPYPPHLWRAPGMSEVRCWAPLVS